MIKMKKPSLKELQKRPALWYDTCGDYNNPVGTLRISYPNGKTQYFDNSRYGGSWFKSCWSHRTLKKAYGIKFLGWL